MRNGGIVLVFKVNNREECYARCLEKIEYFESKILDIVNKNDLKENIKSFLNDCKKAASDNILISILILGQMVPMIKWKHL
jgi:hypothetical protein